MNGQTGSGFGTVKGGTLEKTLEALEEIGHKGFC